MSEGRGDRDGLGGAGGEANANGDVLLGAAAQVESLGLRGGLCLFQKAGHDGAAGIGRLVAGAAELESEPGLVMGAAHASGEVECDTVSSEMSEAVNQHNDLRQGNL